MVRLWFRGKAFLLDLRCPCFWGGAAAVGVVGTMEIVVVLAIAIAICGSSGTGWGNDDRRWSSAASAVVTVSDGDGRAVGASGLWCYLRFGVESYAIILVERVDNVPSGDGRRLCGQERAYHRWF